VELTVSLVVDLWHRFQRGTPTRVGKNALALLAAQTGARLLSLLLIAQLTRAAGAASLGRYLLAMTVEGVTVAISDLGLNIFTTREFVRDRSAADAQTLWGAVLGLKLLAAALGILLLNGVVAPLFFPGERRLLIALISPALLCDALNGLAVARIKAQQRMELSSAIQLAANVVTVLLGLLLLRTGYDERGLLIAYWGIGTLASLAHLSILRGWQVRPRWAGLPRRWREVLREATPFAITGMVAMLYRRVDLLMLSYWQGDLAAGLYGAAYRLWEALGILPTALLDALFPELSRLGAGRVGWARLRSLYRRARLATGLITALLTLFAMLAAPYLIPVLYGHAAGSAVTVRVFRLLLLALPFTYLYLLNGHALYAVEQQRRVALVMVIAVAANALGNAVAVPRWSYWGAVAVACLSELLLFGLLQAAVRRSILRLAGHVASNT
jgi:O-antigen/teichoic acid export membrane protein